MRLLVGLGNPGPKYNRNRHNIGFMAVDEIVRRHSFSAWRTRFEAETAEGLLAGEKVLVLKPTTYMNESGRAVGAALRFFKLAVEDIMVLYDEIDLAPGKVRVKRGGGHAGHNGIRNIAQHIGNPFLRVRIGVGHPGVSGRVSGHVLDDFSRAEMDWVAPLIGHMADCAPLLLDDDDGARFMTRLALALNPPPPKEPPKGPKERPHKDEPTADEES
jgi:PTH1 family peptidyl-tRNA hydrolase